MHQKYVKGIGHRTRSRAKDSRSSLPGPVMEKQYRVLGIYEMRARLFA